MQTDGSFNGLVGLIEKNTSDFLLAPMVLTANRLTVAESTAPLYCENGLTLLSNPKIMSTDLLSISQCFTRSNWVLFWLSFAIISIIKSRFNCTKFISGFFHTLAILLRNGKANGFFIVWVFLAFFYTNLFANDMLAKLTSDLKHFVKTLEELRNDSTMSALVMEETFEYETVLKVSALQLHF